MKRRGRTKSDSTTSGFTLIELLIYMMLLVLVLVVVGGVLINTLNAQNTVGNATRASNSGQLVARSIGHSVRNASTLWHSPAGAVPEVLMARTVGSDAAGTWFCQAWAFDSGNVRTKISTSAISTSQTSVSVATWTLLASGMQPISASSAPIFTLSGRQIDLNMEAQVGGGRPVLIRTSSVSRQPVAAIGAVPACFP